MSTRLSPTTLELPIPPSIDVNRVPTQRTTSEVVFTATTQTMQSLKTSIPLIASDILAVAISWWLARLVGTMVFGTPAVPGFRALFGLLGAVPIAMMLFGLYPGLMLHPSEELKRVTSGATIAFVGLIIASFIIRNHILAHLANRLFHLVALSLTVTIFRFLTRAYFSRKKWWRHPVAIYGNVEEAEAISNWLDKRFYTGLRVKELGKTPRHAIVAEESMCNIDGDPTDDNILVWHYPTISVVSFVGDEPYVTRTVHNYLLMPLHRAVKRVMDVLLVLATLPLSIPVFVTIAITIKLTSRGPVFYSHGRLGKNGKSFGAWKFRSMVVDADTILQKHLDADAELRAEWKRDQKLKNDPRITSVGRFLRNTSLDELPQLWNVFVGDMSLVGPRPIVTEEIQKYGKVYDLYTCVLPGITGLWQISGRNNTTYKERLAYDSFYVRKWSPWLDIYILIRTVITVLTREGAY